MADEQTLLVQSLHRVALYTGAAGGDGRKRNDDEGVETERRRRRDWRKRQKSDLLLFFMCWEPHRAAGWKLAWQQEQRDPPQTETQTARDSKITFEAEDKSAFRLRLM